MPELECVVKVDQFRTHLLDRDFSSLSILKLVGPDTLDAFGRQLAALHTPHRVDWAARFGLQTVAAPASVPAPVGAGPARSQWRVKYDGPCAKCHLTLTRGTPAVWRQVERRMYCLECGSA